MTLTVRAHFDGTALIPDEPLDLPVGEPLKVTVEPAAPGKSLPVFEDPNATLEDKLAAIDRIFATGTSRANLPDEALSRESIYGDER